MNALAKRLFTIKRVGSLPNYKEFLAKKGSVKRTMPVIDGFNFRMLKGEEDIPRVAHLLTEGFKSEITYVIGKNNLECMKNFWIKTLNYDTTTRDNFLLAEVDNEVKGFIKIQDFEGKEKHLPLSEVFKIFPFFGVLKFLIALWQVDKTSVRSEIPEKYIEYISVDSKARGKKIARNVLEYFEYIAEQRGAQKVALTVYSNNKPAINLYLRAGYTTTYEISGPKCLNAGHEEVLAHHY
ncbi:DgyrCDS14674 [Dimorphilus gyrociliatus]|uniref:N-terminal methionine N(alpha)-acetyltransferase NatE n=1 Tax=Dimorphilus gyrociliatus TaxID=2664684 RepID=A0A7I8WEE9_9ANNE|nr:DgyrCDS14674 [Dimorphilus gyrociliatus]